MKLKHSIAALCILREAAKTTVVLAGILFITLPGAWAEGGQPLFLVALAMAGCAGIIYGLCQFACNVDYRVYRLRREQERAEQWEREAPQREARRRQEWMHWFAQQNEV
jgi:hypothetical protein